MRKRRRNITIVNNEIDYDKLAEAIVKANEKVEEKKRQGSKVLTSAIAMFLCLLFGVLGLAVFFVTLSVVASYIQLFTKINNLFSNTIDIIFLHVLIIVIIFALLTVAIILILSAIETYREKDKNFIVDAFSGVVGFAALVVAVIALFKGVG